MYLDPACQPGERWQWNIPRQKEVQIITKWFGLAGLEIKGDGNGSSKKQFQSAVPYPMTPEQIPLASELLNLHGEGF